MPLPSSIYDLSTSAASNSPAGSDAIGTSADDYFRTIQAILKQQFSTGTQIASGATITPLADGNFITVTGTSSITTIASTNSWNGRIILLKFAAALTLTHSANLVLPNDANITTSANEVFSFVQESTGVWRCISTPAINVTLFAKTILDDVDATAARATLGAAALAGLGTQVFNVAQASNQAHTIRADDLQKQTHVSATTGGTSTAFTAALSPVAGAYSTQMRMMLTLHTAPGSNPTVNIDGLGAKNWKYKDSTGTKQFITSTTCPSGYQADCVYDGTDIVVLNPLNVSAEYGTWTPALTFDTPGNLSVAYTYQTGRYVITNTQSGRLVTASFAIATSTFTHTTASGNLKITGLPVSAANVQDSGIGALNFQGITKSGYTQFNISPYPNQANAYIQGSGSGVAGSLVGTSDMPTGTAKIFYGEISYIA